MLRIRIFLTRPKVFELILLIYTILIISLIAVFIIILNNTDKSFTENQKLYNQINILENNIKTNNMKMFEEKLNAGFTKDELKNLIQNNTKYSLLINDQEIKDKSLIYSNTQNISVKIKEIFDDKFFEILPKNITEYGSLLKLTDSLKIMKISSNAATFTTNLT